MLFSFEMLLHVSAPASKVYARQTAVKPFAATAVAAVTITILGLLPANKDDIYSVIFVQPVQMYLTLNLPFSNPFISKLSQKLFMKDLDNCKVKSHY